MTRDNPRQKYVDSLLTEEGREWLLEKQHSDNPLAALTDFVREHRPGLATVTNLPVLDFLEKIQNNSTYVRKERDKDRLHEERGIFTRRDKRVIDTALYAFVKHNAYDLKKPIANALLSEDGERLLLEINKEERRISLGIIKDSYSEGYADSGEDKRYEEAENLSILENEKLAIACAANRNNFDTYLYKMLSNGGFYFLYANKIVSSPQEIGNTDTLSGTLRHYLENQYGERLSHIREEIHKATNEEGEKYAQHIAEKSLSAILPGAERDSSYRILSDYGVTSIRGHMHRCGYRQILNSVEACLERDQSKEDMHASSSPEPSAPPMPDSYAARLRTQQTQQASCSR